MVAPKFGVPQCLMCTEEPAPQVPFCRISFCGHVYCKDCCTALVEDPQGACPLRCSEKSKLKPTHIQSTRLRVVEVSDFDVEVVAERTRMCLLDRSEFNVKDILKDTFSGYKHTNKISSTQHGLLRRLTDQLGAAIDKQRKISLDIDTTEQKCRDSTSDLDNLLGQYTVLRRRKEFLTSLRLLSVALKGNRQVVDARGDAKDTPGGGPSLKRKADQHPAEPDAKKPRLDIQREPGTSAAANSFRP